MRRTFVLSRTPFAASLLALTLAGPALAQTEQTDTGQTDTGQAATGQTETGTAGQADETTAAPQTDEQEQAGDADQPTDQADEAEAATAGDMDDEATGQPGDMDDEATGQAGGAGDTDAADQPMTAGEPGAAQPGAEALPPRIQETMRRLQAQLTPAQMEAVRAMMVQMAQIPENLGVGPGQTGQTDLSGGTDATEVADADMPGAATTGRMRNMAEEVGPEGRTVMLDIEGFSQTIYERGFRQGYIRGVTDARTRFIGEMERMRQQGMLGAQRSRSGEPGRQDMQGAGAEQSPGTVGEAQPAPVPAGSTPPPGYSPGAEDRGTVIVLPPGVSPQAFIDQLMRANEAGQQDQ